MTYLSNIVVLGWTSNPTESYVSTEFLRDFNILNEYYLIKSEFHQDYIDTIMYYNECNFCTQKIEIKNNTALKTLEELSTEIDVIRTICIETYEEVYGKLDLSYIKDKAKFYNDCLVEFMDKGIAEIDFQIYDHDCIENTFIYRALQRLNQKYDLNLDVHLIHTPDIQDKGKVLWLVRIKEFSQAIVDDHVGVDIVSSTINVKDIVKIMYKWEETKKKHKLTSNPDVYSIVHCY